MSNGVLATGADFLFEIMADRWPRFCVTGWRRSMHMPMIQLIYASHPFDFDEGTLVAILTVARSCNERDGITGALICRGDLYLQLLEGPQETVEAAYQRIETDHRHLEIKLLSHRTVTERLFPAWAMRDDPARSWMWNQDEVKAGAVERATEAEAVAIFERLAREPA
jgi:hypothetical protein